MRDRDEPLPARQPMVKRGDVRPGVTPDLGAPVADGDWPADPRAAADAAGRLDDQDLPGRLARRARRAGPGPAGGTR